MKLPTFSGWSWRDLILRVKLQKGLLHSKIRQRLIGPHASHVLVNSFNGKLLVPAADFIVGKSLALHGEYDRPHVEKLLGMVDRTSKLLFVGSHIGALVIPMAKAVREVVAIEANPAIFATLQMNLLLNGCDNVRALNFAASDKREKVKFLASPHNSGGSRITPKKMRMEFEYDHPREIEVEATALDDLLPDFSPTHIVMDIEGAETTAIAGMPRLLASSKVFVVEFLPNNIENVAGISCEEFLKLIPFDRIELLDNPNEKDIIAVAKNRFYYGGADLLCYR